jgi:hypothetical protein
MTLEEYNERFKEALRKVETDLGKTMVKIGQTALVRIKQRVIEEGKDAKGGGFPPYSTKPMLVGAKSFRKKDSQKFFGKDKNKLHRWVTLGGNRFEQFLEASAGGSGDIKRLAVLEGGYRELREISLGRGHGDKVNFSFTNSMWGDIHIVSNSSDHDNGVVIIGALRQEEKDKLYYNTERNKRKGGNEILDLSQSEIEEIKELYKVDVLNIFKSSGL